MTLYVDIKKSFRDFKLNIKFEANGGIFALLGASGSGKSMTLKCIAGIEKPDEGKIVLGVKVLFDSDKKINLAPQKRKTGYLFQNYALFPNMTVEENIAAGIQLPKREKGKIIEEIMKSFYLDGLEKRYPSQISGGQQQRVAIARILVSQPDILMLDEPFSALDNSLKWQLEQEISYILEKFSGPTLFVSHNRDEVYRLCDRIAVMSNGKIEVTSEKRELFDNPKTLAAAKLTGCKNISKAKKLSDHSVYAEEWNITLNTQQIVPEEIKYVGIRAHSFYAYDKTEKLNTFKFLIEREIEDTFSNIILFKFINNDNTKSLVRWDVSKEAYKDMKENDKLKFIKVEGKDILLMTK